MRPCYRRGLPACRMCRTEKGGCLRLKNLPGNLKFDSSELGQQKLLEAMREVDISDGTEPFGVEIEYEVEMVVDKGLRLEINRMYL